MTHEQAQDLILDLAYGELAPDEAREVERHASQCAECGAAWQRIGETRRLAGRFTEEPVPMRGRAEILEAARLAVPGRRRWARSPSRRVTWAIATTALFTIVVGVTLRISDERAKGRSVEDGFVSLKGSGSPERTAREGQPAPAAIAEDRPRAPAEVPSTAPANAPTRLRSDRDGAAGSASSQVSPSIADWTSTPAPSTAPAVPSQSRLSPPPVASTRPGVHPPPAPEGGRQEETSTSTSTSSTSTAKLASPSPSSRERTPGRACAARGGVSETATADPPTRLMRERDGAAGSASRGASPPPSALSPPAGEQQAVGKKAAPPAAMARRLDAAPAAPAQRIAPTPEQEVDRRRAAGELVERVRRLTCRGAPQERVALVDGAGRVVKLTVREADGTVREGWYDDEGALRASRARRGGADAGDPILPLRDPMSAFEAPCRP